MRINDSNINIRVCFVGMNSRKAEWIRTYCLCIENQALKV